MKTFILDIENVQENGLLGIEKLNNDSNFILFDYEANSQTLKKIEKSLQKSNIPYKLHARKSHRKQAMDFNIVSYMGLLLGSGCKNDLVILSNDKGYTSAIECFMREGFENVYVCSSVETYLNKSEDEHVCYNKPARTIKSKRRTSIEGVIRAHKLAISVDQVMTIFSTAKDINDFEKKINKKSSDNYKHFKPVFEAVIRDNLKTA